MPTDFYPGLSLDIKADDWEPSGDEDDPTARLHLIPMLHIGGMSMHFEAHAVHMEPGEFGSTQEADHPWGEEVVNAIYEVGGGDKPLVTTAITIDGRSRDYVFIAYPFCE